MLNTMVNIVNQRTLTRLWVRFLPWAVTAGLSVVTDRGVPLFAVVGGPVLARNLGEFFAAARAARTPPSVHAAAGLVAAALLLAAWCG